MSSSPALFTDVTQSTSFWSQYVFASDAILLIGFTFLVFLVFQCTFLYVFFKRKQGWTIFASNLITAALVWAITIYCLYPQLVLDLVF